MALVLNSTLGIGFAWLLRSANENQLRLAGLAMVAILLLAAWRMAELWGLISAVASWDGWRQCHRRRSVRHRGIHELKPHPSGKRATAEGQSRIVG
jgi:hypothetical protein